MNLDLKILWSWVERIVTLWGFFAILIIIFSSLHLLPYYEIVYKKKTDITPRTSIYPGEKIRLSAEFTDAVELPDIESISWELVDSSGNKSQQELEGKDVDIQLEPDKSGILNIKVKAKLKDDADERTGSSSIQIVQTKPEKVKLGKAKIFLPADWPKIKISTLQFYDGLNQWANVKNLKLSSDNETLVIEGSKIPIWNGKTFLRYKSVDNPFGSYEYQALNIIPKSDGLNELK